MDMMQEMGRYLEFCQYRQRIEPQHIEGIQDRSETIFILYSD